MMRTKTTLTAEVIDAGVIEIEVQTDHMEIMLILQQINATGFVKVKGKDEYIPLHRIINIQR